MNALNLLKLHKIKITSPRKEILSILINKKSPISAYELKDELSKKEIDLNISTIYRVLDSFIENKIVHKIKSNNTFLICAENDKSHCHHFMICTDCGKVDEFESHDICEIEDKIAKENKFKPISHSIEIMGKCIKCN